MASNDDVSYEGGVEREKGISMYLGIRGDEDIFLGVFKHCGKENHRLSKSDAPGRSLYFDPALEQSRTQSLLKSRYINVYKTIYFEYL